MTVVSSLMGSSKRVLMLGAGFVTGPCLKELDNAGIAVTVACRTLKTAQDLCKGHTNCKPISLDVGNTEALEAEVANVDLVISLIPYTYHDAVIKAAIAQKKHVVTTSYINPKMAELDSAARDAGITVLNEIGLDPGIDHLYAVKTIDEVHRAGGKITKFLSYCGGLPAPEASDNPFGYKFSWSARGALLALRNTARFHEDGKIKEIPGPELMSSAKPYFVYPGYAFVAYANRDSTGYKARYKIPEAETIIRGTLRYQGFPEFVRTLVDIGFFSEEEKEFLKPSDGPVLSWKEATAKILGATGDNVEDLTWAISSKSKFADNEEKSRIMDGIKWLGLLSDDKIVPCGTPIDTLCATLSEKMQYEEGERDFVMLQHKFEIEHKNGEKEIRTSTLCEYGEPNGTTAMARLVGIPCAVAVMQILDGKIKDRGVIAPMEPSIVEPLRMQLLEKYGIEMKEKTIA